MSEISVTRRIDELGRIVLPKELLGKLSIKRGDSLWVNFTSNGEIVMGKYSKNCELCEKPADLVKSKMIKGKYVCPDCLAIIKTITY